MKRLCLLAFVTAAIAFRTANYASNNCPKDIKPGDVKLVPHPTDCHKYYVCSNGQEKFEECGKDNRGVQMCFDREICDKAEVVPCCKTPTESNEPPTKSTEPTTQSTVPPTKSTVPPTKSTVPPTKSTEPPTESTEPPTESTVKPTTPSENKTSCAPNRLKSIETKFWWLKAIFA